MRRIAYLTFLLLMGAAAAQPGPDPRYPDAATYAVAYVGQEAANASADPVAYATAHANASAVEQEVAHTLYIACWAADDQGVQHEVCDPYYTPRGQAQPEQPEPPAPAALNETANATEEFVTEAADVVNDTLADPGSAPSQADRLVTAAKQFLQRIGNVLGLLVGGVATALGALLSGLGGLAGGLSQAGLAAAEGLVTALQGALGGLALVGGGMSQAAAGGAGTFAEGLVALVSEAATGLSDAAVAAGAGIADGASAAASGLAAVASGFGAAVAAISSALGDGIAAAAGGVADGAKALGGAVADAGQAMGAGVANAGRAVGQAIDGAVEAVTDALRIVSDKFDGKQAPAQPELPTPDADPEGLLDGVADLL